MSELKKSAFANIFAPVMVLFITPILVALGSWISTKNWSDWFSKIPSWIYVLTGFILCVWILFALIRKRLRHIKRLNNPSGPMFISVPRYGYQTIAEYSIFGAKWRVRIPAHDPYRFSTSRSIEDDIHPDNIDIETTPRCSQCGTELRHHIPFGQIPWDCVGWTRAYVSEDSKGL